MANLLLQQLDTASMPVLSDKLPSILHCCFFHMLSSWQNIWADAGQLTLQQGQDGMVTLRAGLALQGRQTAK